MKFLVPRLPAIDIRSLCRSIKTESVPPTILLPLFTLMVRSFLLLLFEGEEVGSSCCVEGRKTFLRYEGIDVNEYPRDTAIVTVKITIRKGIIFLYTG
mmetsp:Transcript_8610/g.9870  ORF Transcript_8610/g.9870 Transcript_8610/m.9870 type:complete len:98 (+) Transcript_8610:666-959(+)